MERYALIMAGGGGIRFWPLSRQNMPKQLLNISGNDVMINETIRRISSLIPGGNTCIITTRSQGEAMQGLVIEDIPRGNILLEPEARNTAACIAYGALVINSRNEDAIMCVLPADHYIADENRFRKTLERACHVAEKTGKLVTIGIKPAFPATGYGYMQCEPMDGDSFTGLYEVERFIEKPSFERAREYFDNGNYFWNSGMFVWKVSTILNNIERYLPRLFKTINSLKEFIGTASEPEMLDSIYHKLQSISIDFGVMERSDEVVAIQGDFGWNDVGSWDALGAIFPADENGNIIKARHSGMNTRNSIIYGNGRLIATIGLDNMIVADTPDALLICPKGKAQEVKALVELLKRKGMEEYT